MTDYVGTAPGVRELAALTITKVSVGPMDNNSYLLRCRATGAQLLVDAANEPRKLVELCGGRLDAIVTTHQHRDHWENGLADVVAATGARTYAGAPDVAGIAVPTDVPLQDGEVVRWGEVAVEVIRLTGHTPGSVALLYEDPAGHPHLFTGDSLFPGGPGRTTNPAEFDSLMTDLETKVFGRLPDETWFYPGHGRDSTLGKERPAIPEWRSRGW
ncbi:glyoxylase-like metal-dependent hydrolase (beta-lactamase superfamily II) [Krasilnikovia cinnamomea]|uniref:Glyoxylase-like metal-dependent hydrolase (Beta-lactamase superfamily II) n=1 Tax=Krasilnikovia cinnamomea TaxID=349313 RepID=A0A4Q7ZFV8_9ACTN|nr:MBL fold metallo-hydrolase [Krasilnikovia cinnamomea]RZU49191.1 glyoxylase-like metal-dependent hydrolase (beta-lactamase superfamily II) [Krasilnikovia cinnamomea]